MKIMSKKLFIILITLSWFTTFAGPSGLPEYGKRKIAKIIDGNDSTFALIYSYDQESLLAPYPSKSNMLLLNNIPMTESLLKKDPQRVPPGSYFYYCDIYKDLQFITEEKIRKIDFNVLYWYSNTMPSSRGGISGIEYIFIWNGRGSALDFRTRVTDFHPAIKHLFHSPKADKDLALRSAHLYFDIEDNNFLDPYDRKKKVQYKIAKMLDGKPLTFAFIICNRLSTGIEVPEFFTAGNVLKVKFPNGQVYTHQLDKADNLKLVTGESTYRKFDLEEILKQSGKYSLKDFEYGISELIWEINGVTRTFYLFKTNKPMPENGTFQKLE